MTIKCILKEYWSYVLQQRNMRIYHIFHDNKEHDTRKGRETLLVPIYHCVEKHVVILHWDLKKYCLDMDQKGDILGVAVCNVTRLGLQSVIPLPNKNHLVGESHHGRILTETLLKDCILLFSLGRPRLSNDIGHFHLAEGIASGGDVEQQATPLVSICELSL